MKHAPVKWQADDGITLAARYWAPDADPRGVVALVHGHGEHSGRYAPVAAFLAERGLATIALDQRGHGESGGKRGHSPSYDHLMNDIERLIIEGRTRVPDGPLILYGHSMGGAEVLNFVLRRNPSAAGIIVTAPLLKVAFEPPAWKIALGRGMQRIWPSLTQPTGLPPVDLTRDAAVVRAYEDDPLVHDRMSARLFVDLMAAGAYAIEHAPTFPAPLFLAHGTADRLTAAPATETFAQRMGSGCTLKLYDGWYHELHHEPEKQTFFDDLAAWMDPILAAAR